MNPVPVKLSDLKDQIRRCYVEAMQLGSPWCYVDVSPDGSVGRGIEHSPQTIEPSGEYTLPGPRRTIVWSHKAITPARPGDGVFEANDCPAESAEFWTDDMGDVSPEPTVRHRHPKRLTADLVADLEWDDILAEVEPILEQAGYAIV